MAVFIETPSGAASISLQIPCEGDEIRLKRLAFFHRTPLDMLLGLKPLREGAGICLKPVSYTHLDVYKRQEWKRSRSRAVILIGIKDIFHVCISVKRSRSIRVSHDLLDGFGIEPETKQVYTEHMPKDVRCHIRK